MTLKLLINSDGQLHGPTFTIIINFGGMFSLCAIHTLVTIRYVKKEVLFMMFLVELTHRSACGWDHIVNEEKQCILSSQVNSLSDEEVKLSN